MAHGPDGLPMNQDAEARAEMTTEEARTRKETTSMAGIWNDEEVREMWDTRGADWVKLAFNEPNNSGAILMAIDQSLALLGHVSPSWRVRDKEAIAGDLAELFSLLADIRDTAPDVVDADSWDMWTDELEHRKGDF
jgi:hypothetical protein